MDLKKIILLLLIITFLNSLVCGNTNCGGNTQNEGLCSSEQQQKQQQLEFKQVQIEELIKQLDLKQVELEKQIKQLSVSINQVVEFKERNNKLVTDSILQNFKENGIEVSFIKIGSQWKIAPEQLNEQFLVFRHSAYNVALGDRRFAYNGKNYSNQ